MSPPCRSDFCSDRPANHILTKHVLSGPEEKSIAILQYDEYYRRWRKSFQFILGPADIKRPLPLLESEAALRRRRQLPPAARDKDKFTETELASVGQAAVGAAVDTTLATFKNLMVAFAAFPAKLVKAQEEWHRVAGGEPLHGDRIDELVSLKACVSEVLRWRPTTPQALPHVLTRDEHGTMFIANAWTTHRNEEEYEQPHDFIPERFLDNTLGLRPSVATADRNLENSGRRALYAFGSGRRQCPGEQSAFTSSGPTTSWSRSGGRFDFSVETGFKDSTVTAPVHPEVTCQTRSEKKRSGVVADAQRTQDIARDLLGLEF
ncbi:cytochrome P450 21 [Apiospora aurea]|uniref:Cytochrome P450 21 n=1 Tax=Apiospora aurea TaxID=335848 RepID=A0ABR1PRN8_9PEZI